MILKGDTRMKLVSFDLILVLMSYHRQMSG